MCSAVGQVGLTHTIRIHHIDFVISVPIRPKGHLPGDLEIRWRELV